MRQKKKLKKALSLLLTAAMVLSLNVPVFADEADDGNGEDNATNSVQFRCDRRRGCTGN